MTLYYRGIARVKRSLGRVVGALTSPAPVRPVVMIQSDDWGRVGIPSPDVLDQIREAGFPVGESPWDLYGIESASDLEDLGALLQGVRDQDGKPACITANFVVANADLRAMAAGGFEKVVYVPISEGLPAPWTDSLVPAYRALVDRGVFYPGLHGFTHFNAPVLEAALRDKGDLGSRARLLAGLDVIYLRSVTPEYNFALLSMPASGEVFMPPEQQKAWLQSGIDAFQSLFGFKPVTFCAPGYRSNDVTRRFLKAAGVSCFQLPSKIQPMSEGSLLVLGRNVSFEPVLSRESEGDLLDRAMAECEAAVARGSPVIICSHSINYITRFLDRASEGRSALEALLTRLKARFPDLRFASDADFHQAWTAIDPAWFRPPTPGEQAQRLLGSARVG